MRETRRELIRKAVVGAGIVWAAPVVHSVTPAAAAGTPPPTTTSSTVPTCVPPDPCPATGAWTRFDFLIPTFSAGPFDIVATGGPLQVTDAFCIGDRFEIFVDGTSLGVTSPSCGPIECGPPDTNDPDLAYASGRYSTGCFPIAPGPHTLLITVDTPHESGTAYFRGVTVVGGASTSRRAGGPNG